MKSIKYMVIVAGIIGGLGGLHTANAQSVTSSFIQMNETSQPLDITKDLQFGSRGDQVVILQQILSSVPDVYPEKLVTGYFGPLTKRAVEKLQAKYELAATGVVRGETLKRVNSLSNTVNKSLVISGLTTSVVGPWSSMVSWKTDQPAISELYYSATPLNENGSKMVVKDPSSTSSHTIEITHLIPGTKYYFSIVAVNPKTGAKSTTMGTFTTLAQ